MNSKMIKKVLRNKHNDFLKSITDPKVQELVAKNSIITGGSIASMLLNERINDYDYYFTNKETAEAVANYYVNKFNQINPQIAIKPEVKIIEDRVKIIVQSAGIVSENTDDNKYQYFETVPDELAAQQYVEETITEADDIPYSEDETKEKYRPVFLSSNAITLSNRIQLVIRFYGNPDEIHKNYDFVHCCNYWTSKDGKLVLNPTALESLLSKNLYYQGSLYPLCSIIRTRKFLKKGWYINAGQYLKMCFQLSELNLTDINVLEEQLTGVDAAYFHEVIDYCRKKQEEDKDWKINSIYLSSIVDKIFG